MKLLSSRFLFNYLFISLVFLVFACGGKKKDPKPAAAKLTSMSLALDGPKAKLDAVASFQETNGIGSTHTAGNTVTISSFSVYNGTLTLEETTGNAKTDATAGYTITYQITGVDATMSAAGDKPTLTTRDTGSGTLKITATKNNTSHSVTFPLTVSN